MWSLQALRKGVLIGYTGFEKTYVAELREAHMGSGRGVRGGCQGQGEGEDGRFKQQGELGASECDFTCYSRAKNPGRGGLLWDTRCDENVFREWLAPVKCNRE